MHPSSTISRQDLKDPAIATAARTYNRLARYLWIRRIPLAVNGVLRRRIRIRWHKLWEYARGHVLAGFQPGMRVLDIGGAATAPVFLLARDGCEVMSLDIDKTLCAHTLEVARRFGWKLDCLPLDLGITPAPPGWGRFDRVVSYCVLEHLPADLHKPILARMADLLVPGGRLIITFDYGEDAPVPDAIRDVDRVADLVEASGLALIDDAPFTDSGERFVLDRKHPDRRFTMGMLALRRLGPA